MWSHCRTGSDPSLQASPSLQGCPQPSRRLHHPSRARQDPAWRVRTTSRGWQRARTHTEPVNDCVTTAGAASTRTRRPRSAGRSTPPALAAAGTGTRVPSLTGSGRAQGTLTNASACGPSKINLPRARGAQARHPSGAGIRHRAQTPAPLETPPPPSLPAASPEIRRMSKDGHHLNRRFLTLALLKQAQKKSSNGMMGRAGGQARSPPRPRRCPRPRGEPTPASPWLLPAAHRAGQSPSAGRSSAQAGREGGRRQRCLRRRASDSNPAPLFSWLRTGLDGD